MEISGWPSFFLWGFLWALKPVGLKNAPKSQRTRGICVQRQDIWNDPVRRHKKRPAPFQLHIKSSHILRSLKKPLLNLIRWWGKETFLVSWIIRCRNGRPGGITLQAKFKEPIRDCSSLSVQDLLPLNSVKQEVRRWTLSGGRRASMRSESRTIPMNSRVVEGPCVFYLIARREQRHAHLNQ